jgi:dihydroxy-acid dehydratase
VAKITGKEGLRFSGPARVLRPEEDAIAGLARGRDQGRRRGGDPLRGPQGGPGMPEMLKVTAAIMGAGLGKSVAMITDGRFSGGTTASSSATSAPEAQTGGPIAGVEGRRRLTIDANSNRIDVALTDEQLRARLATWKAPPLKHTRGVLHKYIRLVKPASQGCVTDE